MDHKIYMQRCFDLARLGAGQVSPNPMVGAVLVHENRVIGEGWHRRYGQAHAEVNAIESVAPSDLPLISHSTLYVSLEPCCIHGRTPPCTDLILRHGIPRVVISCIDQTAEVKGRGVQLLRKAGVEVSTGILETEGCRISAFRNTFTSRNRPFILLKQARSADGFMGRTGIQVWISNEFSNRISHNLRATYDAILVGTNTALTDDPALTNRLWYGRSPVRIVLDRQLKVNPESNLYNPLARTIIVTERKVARSLPDHIQHLVLPFDDKLLQNLMTALVNLKVTSLIVEGGAHTLRKFIAEDLWDEAMVFTGNSLLKNGIVAPEIEGEKITIFPLHDDLLTIYRNDR